MISKHISLNSSDPEYNVTQSNVPIFPWQSLLAYKKFEEAIDSMPKPLLIACRSANRASAVFAAYKVSFNT
jgi:protein tyrosine phosphatase (PTP) superfamily phosphohydrolase (DUF442 family)